MGLGAVSLSRFSGQTRSANVEHKKMNKDSKTPLEIGRKFALEELGPASVELLQQGKTTERLLARVEHGFRIPDAVLAEVHRASRVDRHLANEFVSYFLQDMLRVGSGALRAGLRRYLDTGDLVQSVFGDLWDDLADMKFESRARFISLLGRRLQWKAVDHARRSGNHGEALGSEDQAGIPSAECGPATQLELSEEDELLALVLHRLGERDQRLLRLRLKGRTTEEIAGAENMEVATARKALARALERAQGLMRNGS